LEKWTQTYGVELAPELDPHFRLGALGGLGGLAQDISGTPKRNGERESEGEQTKEKP
jgi:hypothetical protein